VIPRRLIRTVPEHTTAEQEHLWQIARELHPGWDHVDLHDPNNPAIFPITSSYWPECETGAQLADLIRTEYLYWHGGVYIDSDVECWKPFDPLLSLPGFAGWEDRNHIPNAVMGFEPKHPALWQVLKLALARRDQGTWNAGVGVTTEVFTSRDDMLLLPPASFYPIHYRESMPPSAAVHDANPWALCLHHWAHSWANT
jgi:hypothetical protein